MSAENLNSIKKNLLFELGFKFGGNIPERAKQMFDEVMNNFPNIEIQKGERTFAPDLKTFISQMQKIPGGIIRMQKE